MDDPRPASNGARPERVRPLSVSEALRRRPLLAFGTPVAVLLLTVAFVMLVPPVYESVTDVRIDEEQSGVAMLRVLETLSSGSEVQTEMAVLRSRTLAEDVVSGLGLQLTLASPGRTLRSKILSLVQVDTAAAEATYTFERVGPGRFRVSGEFVLPAPEPRPFALAPKETRELGEARVGEPVVLDGVRLRLAPAADEEDAIVLHVAGFPEAVEALQDDIDVSRPDREADVVRVVHRGHDPELVQAVLDALARGFIARRQSVKSAEARSTVAFLDEQIDTLARQLGEAERDMLEFREANRVVSVEVQAGSQVERLAELQALRDVAEMERAALARTMDQIREEEAARPAGEATESPYRRIMGFPTLLQNTATSELLAQLGQIETRVADLLVTRTPDDRDVGIWLARTRDIERQLQGIADTYLRSLDNQVASYDRTLAAFQDELARVPAVEMDYLRRRRQTELLGELFTLLQTRRKEAEIAAAVEDVSVRVIDPAPFPREPVRPKPWLSVALALVVGSVMGVGGAIAAEHMDRTVRDRRDLQAATGTSVLGLIPRIPRAGRSDGGRFPVRLPRLPWAANGRRERPRVVARVGAGDAAVEAYRTLRTNLLFSRLDEPPRALVFTSPLPGDGKSTTAVNLALVMAQQGQRTLLVDADLRRGLLHEVLREAREPGLAEVLFGQATLEGAVRSVEPRDGVRLDFLASGTRPPNPADLIASSRMAGLMEEMLARWDMVVMDAPPLNLVTDAALMGAHCDGVVLVARAGVTEEAPLEYALERLANVRASVLGTVLNGVEERQQDHYGSHRRGAYAYFEG